jgi:hypothetical protein
MDQLRVPRLTKPIGNRKPVLLDGLPQIEGDHVCDTILEGSRLRLDSRMRLIPDENDLI